MMTNQRRRRERRSTIELKVTGINLNAYTSSGALMKIYYRIEREQLVYYFWVEDYAHEDLL